MARTLFISDVHLSTRDEAKFQRLEEILCRRLRPGDNLFLVGDIFEYWVSHNLFNEPLYMRLVERIAERVRSGVRVEFVAGNRDYLIGELLTRRTGARIHARYARTRLDGQVVHLEHGDMIYNKNWKYPAYRRLMRIDLLRTFATSLPRRAGHWVGRAFRMISRATTPPVLWSRTELLERAAPLFRSGAEVVVVGHIHQPQQIDIEDGGRPRTLIVLGDWDAEGHYLEHEAGHWTLRPGRPSNAPRPPDSQPLDEGSSRPAL